jgi:CRP/FNR family transcriptional regulator, cyclic AMP receptor protein
VRETKYLKNDLNNIQKLAAIPVFRDFESEILGDLLKRSKISEYEDGEQIIREGENDPWFYFLISGNVKITKNGMELKILKRQGDIFGEMNLIEESNRTASAYAVGKTVCFTTDTNRIKDISDSNKLVFDCLLYRIFAETATERLRATTEKLVEARAEISRIKIEQAQVA